MITYDRAIEIINEAYDGLIPEIIQRIDISIVDLRIDDNEIRNILSYILDSDYYHRRISETAPDTDIASFIATRFRSTMPTQQIAEVNDQRRNVIDEINDIYFSTSQEIDRSLNEYIFQSGIPPVSNIEQLRAAIQIGADYRDIINEFINLGSLLPPIALNGNLNSYYHNARRINDEYHRKIQAVLDRYVIYEEEITHQFNSTNLVLEVDSIELIGLADFASISSNNL